MTKMHYPTTKESIEYALTVCLGRGLFGDVTNIVKSISNYKSIYKIAKKADYFNKKFDEAW